MKHNALYKQIPNGLKKYRLAKGLTQHDVAKLLKLKDNTLISRWEKGVALPNLINIIKLSKIYKAKFQELFENLITIINNENS